MSYHVLARKYRPETFAQMVGQAHVTGTLRAALKRDKLSHAYLFSGPRGCGKTTVARLLAKALNCAQAKDGDPCGECETCLAIAAGGYLDVLEIDAASNTGVDNIRDLRDMAQYTPTEGGSRIFIIDEVHMLSKGAFNALLKILEEPPARVFFFFATTEVNKIPRTILSRCQRFDFRLFTREELGDRLRDLAAREGSELTDAALGLIVSQAEGSMRDALSLLDQLIAGCEGPIDESAVVEMFGLVRSGAYQQLNDAIIAHDPRAALALVADLMTGGQSLDVFAQGIVADFRNLLVLKVDPEAGSALDLSPEDLERLCRQAESFEREDLLALVDLAARNFDRIHRSSQPRVLLEAAVVEYTLFESRVVLADLVRRLESLAGGAPAAPSGGSGTNRATGRSTGAAQESADPGYRTAPRAEAAPAPAPRPIPTPTASPVKDAAAVRPAAATTVSGWTGFIQALMQTHPGLASCLMEGLPSVDEAGGRLVVAFPRDKTFQVQRLQQQMPVLQESLHTLWSPALRLELTTETADEAAPRVQRRKDDVRRTVAPTQDEVLRKDCGQDPTLGRLVEALDAEPVTGDERDRWLSCPETAPETAPDDDNRQDS